MNTKAVYGCWFITLHAQLFLFLISTIMNNLRKALLICSMFCGGLISAQNIQNPVLPGVADAGVLKYNGKYYIGGVFTNGDFYVSDDLVHWRGPVHVVTMKNDWTQGTGAGNNQIHANDMLYWNGDFHLYWSVNYWGKDRHAVHIVHAQSDEVTGPYTEPNQKQWMDNRIDPMIFKDDDGQLYMYMVRFTDGNTIWARKMKNPLEFSSEPICLFSSLPDTWETMDNRVAEGPWVIKYRDHYYMMYNANHTSTEWGNYQLGVAEADSPLGFQNGNKYSYPVVSSNQILLEENYVDLLRYGSTYDPLFAYVEQQPKGHWMDNSFNDSDWKKGESGFSSKEIKGSTTRHQGTVWKTSALWLRKSFEAIQVGNLALRVAHEGDTKIYLNGQLIYVKQGRDYCIVNLNKKQRSALKQGQNMLAVETCQGRSHFFDVSLFDMKADTADDILMTPGQPNILRGPNGFEWWLIYMANKNNESRGQYINRVHFFDKTLYVDGITGVNTLGYHPEPALPTWTKKEESTCWGVLSQVQPSVSYLFETGVNTSISKAGVVAWWKDAKNQVIIGLNPADNTWFIHTLIDGKEATRSYDLPNDFCWGVYHHFRIERQEGDLKVWLDEIPAPGKSVFKNVIPADVPGIPGVFDDKTCSALFEGAVYTIGFDVAQVQLSSYSERVKGGWLTNYEYSFQLDHLLEQASGCYPVYVDAKNYVKVWFNGPCQKVELEVVKKGRKVLTKEYVLSGRKMVYPDVKYTDFVEKSYRFATPTQLDGLYLSRHEVGHKSLFVDNMFSHFKVEYLSQGEWISIPNQEVIIDQHPAYNVLSFLPVKAEGVRFINKDPKDMNRHIYKIGIHELWKDSYHFRAVRKEGRLYLFIDGQEIDNLEIAYPSSRIGFCSGAYNALYKGVLYYHIGASK